MTPISKAAISRYSRLSTRKQRRREGMFLVEGTKSVLDTLGAFPLEAIVATPLWFAGHPEFLATVEEDSLREASTEQLKKISSLATAPDVVAVYRIPEGYDDGGPVSNLPDDLYIVLDGVQDPGNIGTIIRLADWFGIHTIFASPDTVDCYNAKTVQASMGAIGRVKTIYCDIPSLLDANPHLKRCSTLLEGENLFTTTLPTSGFIIFGNEGNGISEEVKKSVDVAITIPAYGPGEHVESLNVAMAASIVVAEFRRRSFINK